MYFSLKYLLFLIFLLFYSYNGDIYFARISNRSKGTCNIGRVKKKQSVSLSLVVDCSYAAAATIHSWAGGQSEPYLL